MNQDTLGFLTPEMTATLATGDAPPPPLKPQAGTTRNIATGLIPSVHIFDAEESSTNFDRGIHDRAIMTTTPLGHTP